MAFNLQPLMYIIMDHLTERVGERAKLFKRGGVWWVNVQHRRRQVRKSLKTRNLKEARRRAVAFEQDLLKGTTQRSSKNPAGVVEATAAYLRHVEAEDRAAKTLAKYRSIMTRVEALAERVGIGDMTGIDHGFIDTYRQQRKGAGRQPKTIYNEVVVIRQLVLFAVRRGMIAVRRGMIAVDPLKGLRLQKPKRTPQPCWTPEEVEQILVTSQNPQRSIYTFLAETGARVGEVKWLTWEDIDLNNNLAHIRPKQGWKPKTGDLRTVPLSARARQMLAALPRRSRWVFTAPPSTKYPQGDRQLSERRLLTSLKRLLKRLNLPGHLHTFRHAFISKAVLAGVPEAVIRSWVGHVDPDILKHYTHIADRQSQDAMRRLEAFHGLGSKS